MNDNSQRSRLRDLELRLPPLPHTLPDVLGVLEGPEGTSAKAMAEVVQHDPAVVARLLRQINSSFYGLRRSISSVERAIRMMGPTTAAGTVIGMSMLKLGELANKQARSCFTSLVQHSVGTALLARFLLQELPAGDGRLPRDGDGTDHATFDSDGFTEGLLHDFGKMVLIYNYPEEAAALYEERSIQEQLTAPDERALEQLVFGCDHTEAGVYAASKLHFPESLVDAIRHHHTPEAFPGSPSGKRCLQAVCAANFTTRAMGKKFAGSRASQTTIDWDACANHPVWASWSVDLEDQQKTPRLVQTIREKKDDFALHIDQFLNLEGASYTSRTVR